MEKRTSEEEEIVCSMCLGTGMVDVTGTDPDSHMLEVVGERKCLCMLPDPDDYQEEDR